MGHYLVLFGSYPGPDVLAELATRRIQVLAYVPDNGLMVSAHVLNLRGLDVTWSGPMDPADKISPSISTQGSGAYVVIFQPDTDIDSDTDLARSQGFTIIANPNLLAGQLLVSGAFSALPALAALDAVAYISPSGPVMPISPSRRPANPTWRAVSISCLRAMRTETPIRSMAPEAYWPIPFIPCRATPSRLPATCT